MLGLFRQKNTADEFVNCLRGHYGDTIELITQLDEPFQPLYEVGLFVASIAILKILALNKKNNAVLADEFSSKWLVYLSKNPNEVRPPSIAEMRDKLQTRFPIYKELFVKILSDQQTAEKNPSVQLIWELFTNCTNKEKPNNFLSLVAGAQVLMEIASGIFKEIETRG